MGATVKELIVAIHSSMTHPVHTVMRHVVKIGEVLLHWRRERWTLSESARMGGGKGGGGVVDVKEEKLEDGRG